MSQKKTTLQEEQGNVLSNIVAGQQPETTSTNPDPPAPPRSRAAVPKYNRLSKKSPKNRARAAQAGVVAVSAASSSRDTGTATPLPNNHAAAEQHLIACTTENAYADTVRRGEGNLIGLSKKTPKNRSRATTAGAVAMVSGKSGLIVDSGSSNSVGWTFSGIIPTLRGLGKNQSPNQPPQAQHNRTSTSRGLRKNRWNGPVSQTQDEVTQWDAPDASTNNDVEQQAPAENGSSSCLQFDVSVQEDEDSSSDHQPNITHQQTPNFPPIIHSGNDDGLVVAQAIPDDSALTLMEAQEVDPEELKNRKLEEARKQKKHFLVSFLVINAIIVGVSLGAVFNDKKKDLWGTAAPSLIPSESPSSAPTGALDSVREGLPEYTRVSLEQFNSPQWKAWDWLENHPELPRMQERRKRQLLSLATIYYSMDGDNWPDAIKDKWLQYDDECFWFSNEYGFFQRDGAYGEDKAHNIAPCDDHGFQSLTLGQLRLSNDTFLPPEISLLTSLSILSLPLNDINSSINDFLPSQLYQMSNLTLINLHSNSLQGSIVTDFGRMTKLTVIELSRNRLTGSLPSELGLMTSMSKLFLHKNTLTSALPTQVGQMTSLAFMSVRDNVLTGPLPSEMGFMTSLSKLYLFKNCLTGAIPSELGRMTQMVDLQLDGNALGGPVPRELGFLTSLTRLYLFGNGLSGTLPSDIGRMTTMSDLQLDRNALTGELPSELWQMTGMMNLWLFQNNLSGSIASKVGRITNLKQLRLDNNALTGTVPQQLAYLRLNGSLTTLTLANNSLSGTIPEGLCSLGILDWGLGLSFDCNDKLCGCCWCPCPGSNYSTECDTSPFVPKRDDGEWPGSFPFPTNSSNSININIRTDNYPEETYYEWSLQDDVGLWEVLESGSPTDASSLNSYTIEVNSNSTYRLQIYDSYGDGTCCAGGLGWFTITSSFPSNDNFNGTLIWEAAGYDLKDYLEVVFSIDQSGNIQLEEELLLENEIGTALEMGRLGQVNNSSV